MLKIVPMQEEHIEGFHKIFDAVARERKYLARTQAPSLEDTKKFARRLMEDGVPQVVAIYDDKVVGWCDVIPNKNPIYAHCGTLGMGVSVDYRGQGIGTKLIHEILCCAKKLGLERVDLQVFESNKNAVRLYEKVGFIMEGKQVKAAKIDGRYDNHISMALFLENFEPTK